MSSLFYNMQELQAEVSSMLKSTVEICERNHIMYYCQCGTVLGAIRHQGPIPWDYDVDIAVPSNEMDRFVECCERELPKEYWINYHTVYPKGHAIFPKIGKKGYSARRLHVDVFHLIGIPNERKAQLDLLAEAIVYRNECDWYQRRYNLRSALRMKDIHLFFNRTRALLKNDVSFVQHMDELVQRYSYEQSDYVMDPYGPYGEKNIFKKEVYGEGIMVPYLDFQVRIPEQWDLYLRQIYDNYMQFPPEVEREAALNRVYEVEQIKL